MQVQRDQSCHEKKLDMPESIQKQTMAAPTSRCPNHFGYSCWKMAN